MRIIAGKCRATTLYGFEGESEGLRPTLDRVKESIFDKLQFMFQGSSVLDLFCGTGNLGLEAYSRGSRVTMVDNNKSSLSIAQKNIDKCHAKGLIELINLDYLDAVNRFFKMGKLFDIIFLDPPYEMNICGDIEKIMDILDSDGIIVYEHDEKLKFECKYPFSSKKMGRVVVEYITKC